MWVNVRQAIKRASNWEREIGRETDRCRQAQEEDEIKMLFGKPVLNKFQSLWKAFTLFTLYARSLSLSLFASHGNWRTLFAFVSQIFTCYKNNYAHTIYNWDICRTREGQRERVIYMKAYLFFSLIYFKVPAGVTLSRFPAVVVVVANDEFILLLLKLLSCILPMLLLLLL